MRSVPDVVRAVERRLEAGWHTDVTAGAVTAGGGAAGRWPWQFPLGAPSSSAAAEDLRAVIRWAHGWHDWAAAHEVTLIRQPRRIGGVAQELPTHLHVPDVDTAARLAGSQWLRRVVQGRRRHAAVTAQFPGADAARAIRLADTVGDTDFDLALAAARWFVSTPERRWRALTPRQVPVPGLHAKWLGRNSRLVATLAGLDDLTMADRGTRVHWTYVDPGHRRSGRRRHDSLTIGDSVILPYEPAVVLVVENKDTAVLFPELPGGVVVEGNGNASVGLLPQVPWVCRAETLVYWGDIDQRGYEIVDGLRRRLPRLRTVLMDEATYEAYAEFGTHTDEDGKPVRLRARAALPALTAAERAMYDKLSDPGWTRHRRFEQERIPLPVARDRVLHLLGSLAPAPGG